MDVNSLAVEPDTDEIDPVCADVACQTLNSEPLPLVNGVDGVLRQPGRSDFDGNLDSTVHGEQVDLPTRHLNVPSDDLEALAAQESSCDELSCPAQILAGTAQILSSECSNSSTLTSRKVST